MSNLNESNIHSMFDFYILDENGNLVKETNYVNYYKFISDQSNRRINFTQINDLDVSTVFLGLDYQPILQKGPPILFETMIFHTNGDSIEIFCERYSTKEEAIEGHKRAIHWAEKYNKES